jgi:hypothetical protein
MTYALIDPVLNAWIQRRKLTLSNEEGKPQRRFFHWSSPKAETFQVVIEPEQDGIVRIDAHLIETGDNEEVHYIWEIPVAKLCLTLDIVATSIDAWFRREQ